YTEYNHLNCYYVQKGDAVSKGQIIAAVGSTGVSTGPHLDFRVRESGTYVDPMIYFR
ncbi:MAG: M23 family metallopeptidase, partial [Anaerovoracaceae bacterium]|nr:M23 family metallopeptidase [Anaerovoracaceae bacterium]